MKIQKTKNIIIRVDDEMHDVIKRMAIRKGETLSEYVRLAVVKEVVRDKKLGF